MNRTKDKEKGKIANSDDSAPHFDMYHLKSRLDLILGILFIIALLLLVLIFGGQGGTV